MIQNKIFANNSRLEKKPVAAKEADYSDEDYSGSDFADDKEDVENPLDKLRNKMAQENARAL